MTFSPSPLADKVLQTLVKVLPEGQVPLHEPFFNNLEEEYVAACVKSGFVSSVGSYVDEFENLISSYTNSKFAVATVNGTAALHIGLLVSGVAPGDEVLVPTITFMATASAVVQCGAVPHFLDLDKQTLGIDVDGLAEYLKEVAILENGSCINRVSSRRISAIVPMHTFGHIGKIEKLFEIAKAYNLAIVEDAAEALGSKRFGRHAGTFGDVGVISFNGNKIITTGGGGILLTDNASIAKRAKHLTTTAKIPHKWRYIHDQVAFNYRMPNLNAALGCAQFDKLDCFLSAKRSLYHKYASAFSKLRDISMVSEPDHSESNYWLNAISLSSNSVLQRDEILQLTNEHGILTRPLWDPLHTLEPFKDCPSMKLTAALSTWTNLINIPSSASLVTPQAC